MNMNRAPDGNFDLNVSSVDQLLAAVKASIEDGSARLLLASTPKDDHSKTGIAVIVNNEVVPMPLTPSGDLEAEKRTLEVLLQVADLLAINLNRFGIHLVAGFDDSDTTDD